MKRLLGNLSFTASNARHAFDFARAELDPRARQERILLDFLRRNAKTEFGREHGFHELCSVEDFQARVPIRTYDEFEPWIDRIRRGEPKVLTEEPVLAFETSSGSSGAIKYVPYTRTLLAEFRRAIGAWLFDLFTGRPRLLAGAHYWSISPLGSRDRFDESGAIPIGFESDLEYFGERERRALARVLAVGPEVAASADLAECRQKTLDALVACRELRFLSVWNPSFLTRLLDGLPDGASPKELWPDLTLVSCWTSASAALALPELEAALPGVEVQGKGLLATEGVVSLPKLGQPGPTPAITSHFLEFVDEDGSACLVDELEVGRRYRPLLTTGGGFVRYDLGDQVEALTPKSIEFVGKLGLVSDLVGEKLSDAFVGSTMRSLDVDVGWFLLAPAPGAPPAYELFVERAGTPDLARRLDRALCASPHYDYARRLGQLGVVRVIVVERAEERFLASCIARGQRAGDVKSAALRTELDWREHLGHREQAR